MTDTSSPVAPANDALASSEEDPPIVQSVQIPTPFVVIATPSLSHSCSMHHRAALLEIRGALLQRGIPHAIVAQGGMTYLDRVRDMLATQFLEDFPDATDLFFIDDDVGGEDLHGHLMQFLIRPEPILLGATPLKNDDSPQGATFPVRFLGDGDTGKLIHNSGMMLIDRGPMGFCRIKRAVLQAMIDGGKVLRYREPHSNRMVWHFFSQGVGDDGDGGLTYWGEDTIFIARAALMGIQTWLDPNITFFHDGRKSYRGNCLRELFRQHGKLMQPEGLVPSDVASGPASEVPMIEYPKWVHGELAFSVEDESRLERAWQAAGGVAPIAELADTGVHPDGIAAATSVAPVAPESTAPDGVSASTPVIEDLSQLPVYQAEAIVEAQNAAPEDQGLKPVMVSGPIPAADIEATIEADLNEAAALTIQIAAPAEIPAAQAFEPAEQEPVTTAENTPTIPAEPVEEDPPVPVAGLDQPPLAVAPPAEDSGMPAGELAAEAAGTSAPAAEPAAAQQGTEPTAPASESPGSGDTSPAAEPVEDTPAAIVMPIAPLEEAPAVAAADTGAPAVQAADPPIETVPTATADQPQPAAEAAPAQAVDAEAAAEPVQAPEAETPVTVAAEVEQAAAAAAPARADSVAAAEVPVEPVTDEAAAAAVAAASPGAADTEGAATEPDASSATAEAQPAEPVADAQPTAPGA